ncbi:MAG: spore coat protein [Ruminococcus sp.]|nr:spore coat protein [Ruminococcus sp.]
MDDRNLMENMLILEKGACDLYLHGAIESSTQNVHSAFKSSLNDSLKMQDEIYLKMQAKGWYPSEQADGNKLDSVKQKFSANA